MWKCLEAYFDLVVHHKFDEYSCCITLDIQYKERERERDSQDLERPSYSISIYSRSKLVEIKTETTANLSLNSSHCRVKFSFYIFLESVFVMTAASSPAYLFFIVFPPTLTCSSTYSITLRTNFYVMSTRHSDGLEWGMRWRLKTSYTHTPSLILVCMSINNVGYVQLALILLRVSLFLSCPRRHSMKGKQPISHPPHFSHRRAFIALHCDQPPAFPCKRT